MKLEFTPSAFGLSSAPERAPARWLSAGSWLLVALLLASYPLATVLPGTWGWENGVLEDAQVLVLFGGLVAALQFCRAANGPLMRRAALGAALLWLIAAARELSWGAVLLEPLLLKPSGPVFSSSQLSYHALIHPLLGLAVAISVLLLALGRVDAAVAQQWRDRRLPRFELALMVAGMLLSTLAEGHFHLSGGLLLPEQQAQVWEELSELIAYAALFLAQQRFFGTLRGR